jgi:hypothetical protein
MIAMQYKVAFPNGYDMNIIKKRVEMNGDKTDGFPDLLFKAYLIADSMSKKEYAPLYIWKSNGGMNSFIFDGYYDNILKSFGWQHINIAVPHTIDLSSDFHKSKYVLEIENDIKRVTSMESPALSNIDADYLGAVSVYNPDKWKYVEFYFYDKFPDYLTGDDSVYEVLHISR